MFKSTIVTIQKNEQGQDLSYLRQVFITNTDKGSKYCMVDFSPTGNCQVCSIAHFNAILTSFINIAERKAALKRLYVEGKMKHIVITDINAGYKDILEELFPEGSILVRHPYTSTNNSPMILYLILTKCIKDFTD